MKQRLRSRMIVLVLLLLLMGLLSLSGSALEGHPQAPLADSVLAWQPGTGCLP